MKTFVTSVIFLPVGLTVGFYIGNRDHQKHVTNEAVQLMVQGIESSDRLEAARGIRAIELIDAGNTQQMIQMFSLPIADFYSEYANLTHNDKRTKDLLAKIEQFSRTNQVVAARIRASTNAFFKLPPVWPNP